MSRAAVLLDYATELGGGERAGAVTVLAEALDDPALLRAVLAELLLSRGLPRAELRLVGPWRALPDGSLVCEELLTGRERCSVWCGVDGGWIVSFGDLKDRDSYDLTDYLTREQAQADADERLQEQGWHRVG